MSGGRAAALAVAAAATALAAPAVLRADGTALLAPGRPLSTAVVAMGADGTAAALFPRDDQVRLVLAPRDAQNRTAGRPAEAVPIPRGNVVEGLALASGGRVLVALRAKDRCSAVRVAVRAPDGTWGFRDAGAGTATAVALATAPDGAPAILAVGCRGDVALLTEDPTGAWTATATGAVVTPSARPSLALGAGGVAVAGLDGQVPLILVRQAGAWVPVALPGGPPPPAETVSVLRVGIDSASRPVAVLRRDGPARFGVAERATAPTSWSADRMVAPGSWVPVATGAPVAVDLTSGSGTLVARRADGTLLVEGPSAAATILPVDAIAAAAGPGGSVAYVPRGGPPVLGVGAPPAVTVRVPRGARFGTPAPLTVTVTGPAGPLASVRVHAAGASGATDAAGTVVLRPVLTRSGPVDVVLAGAGPVAPARVRVTVTVRPQPVTLHARVARLGARVVVSGIASSPVALAGVLGRVYLVDLGGGGRGFPPGAVLSSAPGRRAFRLTGAAPPPGRRLAVVYEGAVLRLR